MENLADGLAALLPRAEGNPPAMIQLAGLMRKAGQVEQAIALCRGALALAPDDAELAARARALLNGDVPNWHFTIVADAARNAAYDAALRRAIRPGMRVLEIGTGTGILAMMAARAGAVVVTCEMNPVVADAARRIVERNGYGDAVRVFSGHSDKLTLDELGGRADLLVSEIVSNNLLGEDVLPAHERAIRDLLKPGAQVIPARGRVRVALAEDVLGDTGRMHMVDGFDLSLFNDLRAPARSHSVGSKRIELRSEPGELFDVDLGSARFCTPAKAKTSVRAAGGRVNGIAQWIALDMDEVTQYENRPMPGATSCWDMMFHALPMIETAPGQAIAIAGSHDRRNLTIWIDRP
ncbi:50S ribosomal protein L11 methyltransferase [Sphingomonas sp. ZT3P38]|uniref:methyltransferase domain-containing protein n=1 Tax=Parasphingomonas zepuensis TaxID=3096161 RepID=UPI002FC8FDA8